RSLSEVVVHHPGLRYAFPLVWASLIAPLQGFGQAAPITPELVQAFRFRLIGPAVAGGRIHDVEALSHDPSTVFVATASGGIWKSSNKGTTWKPVFEDQPVSTFGDLAVAPSDPNVIWAGTGEQQNRQSTSWGDGVYRSTDGGETWVHLGLEETRHIARVLVHPTNPDVAYVAALGNLWKPNTERGVFKTEDGGRNWSKVLFIDTLTGVVDMVMDPSDPNTIYAAAYQRQRRTWGFNGGGPGSGIYKTTDGGDVWRELTNGIPRGDKGRIGLAISVTNPRVLAALIEHAEERGTYRSEDGGETWERVNRLNQRPMYYSHIYIDPTNENRIYELGTESYKSEDGGRTFERLPTRPTYDVGVHSDFHTMWIDPGNPKHFYLAGDGGLHETWDMGLTYEKLANLPIGQFYAIGLDMREPYFVYGGMQDNHSWMGPSATRHWIGIINDDWRQIGFGDGMYWQPDPTNHRYVYGNAQNGSYTRLDAVTGDLLDIRPIPPEGEPDYRWDWVSPSLVSQHDPKVIYVGGNRLFISRGRGVSWTRTEDLTRQIDRDTLPLMGVRGADITLSRNDGTSSFGEIVTIDESPLDPAILWVGTDDGNVEVSRDGGASWTEVSRNVTGVRSGTYVSRVLASAASPGAAWVTFDAHRDGDFAPYVFHTDDFGHTWENRTNNLPSGSVNVIVEHRRNPDLVFLGTEHALYVSTDAGGNWVRMSTPTTLYDDLEIHPRDNDLVVATHGRSIWILDDVTPLAEWTLSVAQSDAHLFAVRDAVIFQYWKDTSYRGQAAFAGENPPQGAILTYYLREDRDSASITVANAAGRVVRTLNVPATAGMHRVVWDLRHEQPPEFSFGFGGGGAQGPEALPVLPHPVAPRGPFVSPGTYTVTLEAGTARATRSVRVKGDPLMPLTQEDWVSREAFLVSLLELQKEASRAAETARGLSGDEAQAIARRLRQLMGQLASLASQFNGQGVRQGSLYPPTETQRRRKETIERQLREALEELVSASPS
ncbi:MAG: glycosyl hydrolase, partial [Gemmatimonadales bacterium]